jgi:hypothetical protein
LFYIIIIISSSSSSSSIIIIIIIIIINIMQTIMCIKPVIDKSLVYLVNVIDNFLCAFAKLRKATISFVIRHSEDRTSWYILPIKPNEMYYFSDLFDKVIYMFRTGPLSIFRSISKLCTHNSYLSC